MKKLLFGAVALFLMAGCSGNGASEKQKEENVELQKFAESFARFARDNKIDSIKAVYPTANFDSVASIANDSISISESGAGLFKINYTPEKWIDVKVGTDGKMTVENSKGIAAFPEEKYQTAKNTGMLNDSINDVKTQELLNDEAYFKWLKKNFDSGDYVIEIKPGKYKSHWNNSWGEYWKGSITITLTNLSDTPISKSDYFITYKTYESNGYTDDSQRFYTQNNKHKGIDLQPRESGTINLTQGLTSKFYNFEIKPAKGKESALKYQYNPTGNEYQKYLEHPQ